MNFAQPAWLWALAALPFATFVLIYDCRRQMRVFKSIFAEKLWPIVIPELSPEARTRRVWVWSAAMAFALLALARPQWGTHEEVTKTTGLDVMVALDISSSMNTEDVVPSRLKKAKRLLKTLSERLAGDRMGLVFFARGAYLASPLTTDTEYFRRVVESAESELLKSQGTDVGAGLGIAIKAVDRGQSRRKAPALKQRRLFYWFPTVRITSDKPKSAQRSWRIVAFDSWWWASELSVARRFRCVTTRGLCADTSVIQKAEW